MSDDIVWIEKKILRSETAGYELVITQPKSDRLSDHRYLKFNNNAHKKITSGTQMAFGLTSARLYFKEGRGGHSSYALNVKLKDGAACTVPGIPKEFVGKYKELHYDPVHDLFYVDLDDRQ